MKIAGELRHLEGVTDRTANGHKRVEKDGGISDMTGRQPSFGMFLSWLFRHPSHFD
jgi:hypothetical protein